MSEEADLAVINDLSGATPHQIEAHFGMGSPYHQHFGVYADGIALSEVAPPTGEKAGSAPSRSPTPTIPTTLSLCWPQRSTTCVHRS